MSGPDQAASLEFDEFRDLVKMANNMVIALGKGRKKFLRSEKVLHGVLVLPVGEGVDPTTEFLYYKIMQRNRL